MHKLAYFVRNLYVICTHLHNCLTWRQYIVQNDAGVGAEMPEAMAASEVAVGASLARAIEGEAMIALRNWCSLPLAIYSLSVSLRIGLRHSIVAWRLLYYSISHNLVPVRWLLCHY